mmetsp:Transcript_73323/g.184793  ORF Transcript_73323/g.184793 Transcript_73323/m.184793 type:complete len:498 (-) Transcript_73323:118-1611(-)
MPLEAVMICVDNSDYTRNGDYAPTRFESQTDAVNLVCGAKTQQNPENSVGILTTAGDRVDVLITPTTDLGRMVSELPKITVGGSSDMLRGIQTAQLALKHRQNKNQKQRIIAFVGSPVLASDKELETLGKNLKKNNVSLDLVSFGEIDENSAKLDKLLGAVNSNETSHKVEVPVGPKLLSDVLLSSVIINADGEGGGGAGGGEGFEFGINPSEDPELALALRISMEEERARQQAAEGGAPAPAAGGDAAPAAEGSAPGAATTAAAGGAAPAGQAPAAALPVASDAAVMEAMGMEDMDEELRQALLLSLQEAGGPAQAEAGKEAAPAAPAAAAPAPAAAAPAPAPASGDDKALMEAMGMEDMDEELRQALLLSMQDSQPMQTDAGNSDPPKSEATPAPAAKAPEAAAPAPAAASGETAAGGEKDDALDPKWYQDPAFVSELLGSLPGVDINDPRIQSALKEVGVDKKEGEGGADGKGADGSGSGDANSSGGGGAAGSK